MPTGLNVGSFFRFVREVSYRYKKLMGEKFVSFIGTEKEFSEPLVTRVNKTTCKHSNNY